MREGKLKGIEQTMAEADDDRLERADLETWDDLYHLSVFAGPLLEGEEPEQAVVRLFGSNRRVKFFRCSSLEQLEAEGFELKASEPDPFHYDVVLGDSLTKEVIETFEGCFGEERKNPQWKRS